MTKSASKESFFTNLSNSSIDTEKSASENKILLTTTNEVNFADLDSNLKLPSSWELKDSYENCLSSIFLSANSNALSNAAAEIIAVPC